MLQIVTGKPVDLGTGLQRLPQEREGRGIQFGWAAAPWLVGQPLTTARQEPRAPRPHSVRSGFEEAGHCHDGVPFGEQQQSVGATTHPRIGIGSG